MKSISLPPYAPTLIESTRAMGYTLEAAIADIVDNSISASATSIKIFYFPVDVPFIAVLDNGTGMKGDDLSIAMRYGSKNPNEKRTAKDLGRFGLGMKTASLSQCRTLTVASKQTNGIEARRWDIDHVIETNDWSLLILDTPYEFDSIPYIDELRKLKSGTLVVWQNLDRLEVGDLNPSQAMGKKMDEVRSHLSLVFHRYINGEPGLKKIELQMNKTSVKSMDPFMVSRSTQVMADEVLHIDGSAIIIRPYIIPHISGLSPKEISALGGREGLRKNQGFYIYRNKRLLIWGTWFHLLPKSELSKLARVQVDIPNELDQLWTLDIKKSTAIPPEIVRSSLSALVERLADKSKKTWEFRGKLETQGDLVHPWERVKDRDGLYYRINRKYPLVELVGTSFPNVARNLEILLKSIEMALPLNQLRVDLNSNVRIENEIKQNEHDMEKLLLELLEQLPTQAIKLDFLERIATSDPFANYPHLIDCHKTNLRR